MITMVRSTFLVLVGILGIASLALAAPLSLCDYQTPETLLVKAKLSFTYHYLDDPSQPGIEDNSGRISLTYTHIYNSPSQGFSLLGSGTFGLSGFRTVSSGIDLTGTYRYYFQEQKPFFGFGGFQGSWSGQYRSPRLEVRGGVGYGRFTDVTPLAKAMLIEEDLLRMGAIPNSLSDETLMAVAKEIGRRMEYEKLADLVAKVQELIQNDAGVTLEAKAILDIEGRIKETGRKRFCGGALQAGVGYVVLVPAGEERTPVLDLSADWAMAPEPRSQLLIRTSASASLPWKGAYNLSLAGTYDYEINDTASFAAKYTLEHYVYALSEGGLGTAGRQSAVFDLNLNVHGWRITFQVALERTEGAPGWTQE
ncbi:hypothetical protein J7L84_01125, partial [Candidatus Bipolaricaulota bacterium]|nr:hypothetical protein [Candidatus Bipolaricaulota bacterium]